MAKLGIESHRSMECDSPLLAFWVHMECHPLAEMKSVQGKPTIPLE